MDINKRIVALMERANKTPSEFADYLDVPRSTISHLISGRNKPSLDFLIKIKNTLPDIRWDWLILGDGPMTEAEAIAASLESELAAPTPLPLPDLFTYVNIEVQNDEIIEENTAPETSADNQNAETARESAVRKTPEPLSYANDSRAKAALPDLQSNRTTNEKNATIVRILVLYSDGRFESFDKK